uniref:Uncharacterized protein n=1 Tax=Meloidogyne floridensis TaxID=298350 RepID=A0A915P6N9_9BILA
MHRILNFIKFLIALSLIPEIKYCAPFIHNSQINRTQEIININPTNLDIYFFQVAVSALFKAKANFILRSLPHTERIVFRQCVINTQGKLNLLAKCMVSLFNVRNNFRHVQERKNTKFKENLKINYLNNQEWPLWTQIFKFEELTELAELASIKLKNPSKISSKIHEKNFSKIQRNFEVFTNLEEENRQNKLKNEPKIRILRSKKILKINKKERMRSKRKISGKENLSFKNIDEKKLEKYPNVKKLLEIEQFYDKVERCNSLLQNIGLPAHLSSETYQRNPLFNTAETQIQNTVHFDQVEILSPKLLSIVPEIPKTRNSSSTASQLEEMLMSPTFLSFHEEGNFSIQYLLNLVFTNNKSETLPWLELLLQMSGAAATLKRLLNQLENIKNEIETKILPAVERLEEIDRRFTKLSNWHNKRQKDELELRGYTFLSREQSKMMINGRMLNEEDKNFQGINEELSDDENEIDAILEEDIRLLSKIEENDHRLGEEFK